MSVRRPASQDQGEGLDQQAGERLAELRPIAEREAAFAELVVAEVHQFRLQGADPRHGFAQRESRKGFACREIEVNGELMKSTKLFTRVEGERWEQVYYKL